MAGTRATGTGHPQLAQEVSTKQEELIRHAYRLLGEKGTHRLNLQDVADAAGVSKALVLYYFKTRENLLLTTMGWVLARVADRIRSSIAGAETAEEKIAAMLNAIFIDPKRNRNFYLAYLNLIDHSVRIERFKELSTTFRAIVDAQYADVIRAGLEEGAFRAEDVARAAMVVRAIIDGLFLQWLEEPEWERLHAAYKDLCEQAILAYLRVEPVTEAART